MMEPIVQVTDLRQTYGATVAVDGISFNVRRGEIFGIVGPNGAGKSTTVESLIGLRQPTGGTVRVLGHDPVAERAAVAQRIGVQLQQAALAERIRVREALDLFGSFYARRLPVDPLLARWGLADKANAMFSTLSGGQKQRLFITLALLNDPEIVFLDELTTGLDPQARRQTWEMVARIRDEGKTVVLVTHFMDEAEALCDRVAVIDGGRIIALDTPQRLIERLGGEQRLVFAPTAPVDLAALRALPSVAVAKNGGETVSVSGNRDRLIFDVVLSLERAGIGVRWLRTEQADLEDVFIALTGKALRE